nr:TIGR01777 family oxidoreductase [Corynebacterium hesseae]
MSPLQQAESLADGTSVLSLPGGLKWVARHDLSRYQPRRSFADVCINAPFRSLANWRHERLFEDHPEGTLITDKVDTRIPTGAVESVFAYRQQQLIEDFRFAQRLGELNAEPRTIAITGTHGTVGAAVAAQLGTLGHTVVPLVRSSPGAGERLWRPNIPAKDLLEGIDVLIHLAGEPIFGRFNSAHKEAIRDSRVGPTHLLAQLVAQTPSVSAMVCASAIGIYGPDRGDEDLTEESERGDGFLADVVGAWEEACAPAREAGKRVVNLRTGIVQSANAGILPLLRALFSTGLGGAFGKGTMWNSWVAQDDLSDIFVRAALDPEWQGAINAVSPQPVLNRDYVDALGALLHRPTFMPIPSIGPALLLGKEGARELALANQKVVPSRLENLGHVFRYPKLKPALAHELGGEQLVDAPTCAPEADGSGSVGAGKD